MAPTNASITDGPYSPLISNPVADSTPSLTTYGDQQVHPTEIFADSRWSFSDEFMREKFYTTGCINDDLNGQDWRRLYNKTVLLYSIRTSPAGSGNLTRRWRSEIYDEWVQYGVQPLLEGRFLYQMTRYLHWLQDPLKDVDDFISKHLDLCHVLEEKIPEMPEVQRRAGFWGDPKRRSKFDDHVMVLPTCRAVILLHDMPYELPAVHKVALVLTGDNSRMESGPVTFDSIKDEIIPGKCDDPRVAFVSLAVAVKFLRDLEDREIAVNEVWQEHNRKCREVSDLDLEKTVAAARARKALAAVGRE